MVRLKAGRRHRKPDASRSRDAGAATIVTAQRNVSGRFYRSHSDLAIQLSLDPAVTSVRYVASLSLFDRVVQVDMLVADTPDGRVAFDVVDGRQERDLDEEGLLLVALQHHGIRLTETDFDTIEAEPYSSNCRMVWRYRDHPVHPALSDAIDRAIGDRLTPTISELGRMVGLRHPMMTICALICGKRLQTDLAERPLDLRSTVRGLNRRSHATARANNGAPDTEPMSVIGTHGEA
jgi:hypothetical protein